VLNELYAPDSGLTDTYSTLAYGLEMLPTLSLVWLRMVTQMTKKKSTQARGLKCVLQTR